VRDVVRDHETGRVVPMERPEIAGWAASHLIKDPQQAAALAAAGRALTVEFGADVMSERLADVYTGVRAR
jgi:glycosyltransferase involved in cell wall biosynthesis